MPTPRRTVELDVDAQFSAPPERIRLAILCDVRLYAEGLGSLLNRNADLDVVGTVASFEELVQLSNAGTLDVLLLDMRPAWCSEACSRISSWAKSPHLVGFAIEETPGDVLAATQAGLAAYVPRDANIGRLVEAVRGVVRGELHCSAAIAGLLFRRLSKLSADLGFVTSAAALTQREREIVCLIGQNLTNKEIAWRLHISTATVKNHVHNVMDKLSIHRRSELPLRLRYLT